MIGGKLCPSCAERVKLAARVCRYCAHDFAEPAATEDAARSPGLYIAIGTAITAIIVLTAWWLAPRAEPTANKSPVAARQPKKIASPQYSVLEIGESWNWSAETSNADEIRQVGPYVLRVTKSRSDGLVTPTATVSQNGQAVRLEGEHTSPALEHRFTALQNIRGAPPIILFQSFSGGAHCCNHIQAVGLSGGRLKVIDLGSWDGDYKPLPTDITGDGIVDFVMTDNAFLYAFASYAQSYSATSIYNLIGGQMRDVSQRPAFRKLYLEDFRRTGEVCRNGADGLDRNGACPAFVAAAARLGKLSEAWPIMLAAYDASVDWELPTGCAIKAADCPDGAKLQYKSYPEALLALLKGQGYIPRSWQPTAEPSSRLDEVGFGE